MVDKRIEKEYPNNFTDCFDFSTPDGWESIIHKCLGDIISICPEIKFIQIKEKFGGLRIYATNIPENINDSVRDIIRIAESKSLTTCDVCGQTGELRNADGWYRTRCTKHIKED